MSIIKTQKGRKAKKKTMIDVSSALSDMAGPVSAKAQVVESDGSRKSRFFFKLGVLQVDTYRDAVTMPRTDEPDIGVEEIQASLPKSVSTEAESVREFFVRELAPKILAASAGSMEAHTALAKALGADVDLTLDSKFQRLIRQAAEIQMMRFIQKYMHMSDEDAQQLLPALAPPSPPNVSFHMDNSPPLGKTDVEDTQRASTDFVPRATWRKAERRKRQGH